MRAKSKERKYEMKRIGASISTASTSRHNTEDGTNEADPGDERKFVSYQSSLNKRKVKKLCWLSSNGDGQVWQASQ